MATLNLTALNSTTISWSITGLSSAWNTTNYMEAILSNSPAVNDSPTRPTGVLATQTPTSSGSNTFTPTVSTTGGGAFSGGSTYVLFGTMRAANGNYYQAGAAAVTMPSGRPSNFSWTYAGINPSNGSIVLGSSKVSNYYLYLPASEFSTLQNKINLFRQYKGLGNYSFTSPSSSGFIYNFFFNQCVTSISQCSPPVSVPSSVSSGQIISAASLNGLMNSLNSIP